MKSDIDKSVQLAWLANLQTWANGQVRVCGDAYLRAEFDPKLQDAIRKAIVSLAELDQYVRSRKEGRP